MTKLFFKYKGSRKYVHGTDIFASLCDYTYQKKQVPVIQQIDYQIHKMMSSHLQLEEVNGDLVQKDHSCVATFSYQHPEGKTTYLLRETDDKVSERYQYEEDEIRNCSEVDPAGGKIQFHRPPQFSPIESIVAANKYLLQTLTAETERKWLFGRLRVDAYDPQDAFDDFELTCESNLKLKLVKTKILLRGVPWGTIYFSYL